MSSPLDELPGHASANAELNWALNLPSVNVLIIGACDRDVPMLRARLASVVTVIEDSLPHDLAGTCMVRDAVRLTRQEQEALRRRLEHAPDVRLMTLSAVSLYPFVASGQSDETLYYRLNTVTIHLTAAQSAAVA
jgi:hypothetical protein